MSEDEEKVATPRDDEAEAALAEGADATALERLVGADVTAQLRHLAARVERGKARRNVRVLVIPGVLGSRLGYPGRVVDDTIWLDPVDVRRGNLDSLAVRPDGTSDTTDLGVILFAYLKLKVWLQAKGYRAEFHAYDWRRNVEDLGRELAARVAGFEEEDVRLVCHSYGGLVARAALTFGGETVTRVVTLGTPHEGAFASCMVLRGTHPVIQRIAAVDPRHDPTVLARKVFRTFPSSYHLLPRPALEPEVDPFDPAAWPEEGVLPDPELLAEARATRFAVAALDERFRCVAGVGHDTPLGITRTEAGFAYPLGKAGDGVVPIRSAAPEGARAWYAEGAHGFLPNVGSILAALPDLLDRGETDRLPEDPGDLPERPGTDDAVLLAGFEDLLESLKSPSRQTVQALITEYAAPADTSMPEG